MNSEYKKKERKKEGNEQKEDVSRPFYFLVLGGS